MLVLAFHLDIEAHQRDAQVGPNQVNDQVLLGQFWEVT